MKKLTNTFKFNNYGRIDLRNLEGFIKTPESSGSKHKFWIGTKDNPKTFLVKTTNSDRLSDVAEVIVSKMLKNLGLPYVETALGETLIHTKNEKTTSILDKFFKKNTSKNEIATFSNCVISENFKQSESYISANDIFQLAENVINSSLNKKQKSNSTYSTLSEFENAIAIINKYHLPEETLLNLQKLIIFDYCTGQTDRSSQDIIFQIDNKNNLILAPIIDNEMINFFYYKNSIFKNYANQTFNPNDYTNKFLPLFSFTPTNKQEENFLFEISNYDNLNKEEIVNFTKELKNLDISDMFNQLNLETGYKISPNIPTFFNNFKNSKCDLIINYLENQSIETNDLKDNLNNNDNTPEL